MHNNRNYQIRCGNITRNISEEELNRQGFKTAKFTICEEEFSCNQNLDGHMKESHSYKGQHHCRICDKVFFKLSQVNLHMKRKNIKTPSKCPECGKGFKEHLKICQRSRFKGRKLFRAVRHLNSYNIILGKKSRSEAARKS